MMKLELQNKLFEKYPKIFRQKDLSMFETSMCWGFDCGDGWYNIIDTLCYQIQWHIEHNLKKYEAPEVANVEATQVKEKFGGLRFYYIGGNDFINGLITMAEGLSKKTCEECGAPGTQSEGWWVSTLCQPHHDALEKQRKLSASTTMKGKFEIVEESQNDDGTWNLVFDVDDEFQEWFKEREGLKRWSSKRFQKILHEALVNAIEQWEEGSNKAWKKAISVDME
jgi:hypothetical protein